MASQMFESHLSVYPTHLVECRIVGYHNSRREVEVVLDKQHQDVGLLPLEGIVDYVSKPEFPKQLVDAWLEEPKRW